MYGMFLQENILIGVTSSRMLFRSIFVNISNELVISATAITSNPSKAVKSIIWLISLELNYY